MKTEKHTPVPTYSLTTITVQGEEQEAFEVYADDTKEQTIAFVFDEKCARLVASRAELLATCEEALCALDPTRALLERGRAGNRDVPEAIKSLEQAIAKLK